MGTDIKLSKAQLTKLIKSVVFLGKTLGNIMSNLGKNALMYLYL